MTRGVLGSGVSNDSLPLSSDPEEEEEEEVSFLEDAGFLPGVGEVGLVLSSLSLPEELSSDFL